MRTIQEIDRKVCEFGEHIDQMRRFFNRMSSEMKDLRNALSATSTRRVTPGYAMAKDMIQALEKKVAEKEKVTVQMTTDIEQRDLTLSIVEKRAEENRQLVQELRADILEKQNLIEEMRGQAFDLRRRLTDSENVIKNQRQLNEPYMAMTAEDKEEPISRSSEKIIETDEEIKQMRDVVIQLQKKLYALESQQNIDKRLRNNMKIHQLESMVHKSLEIEELLKKLRDETANINDRLMNGSFDPVNAIAVSSQSVARQMLSG